MLKGLILIGGKSSRMEGFQKAWINVHGMPQYQYLLNQLTDLQIPTYISCNKEQALLIPKKFPIIIDSFDSIGPLGGIVSAMEYDNEADWLVVACDLLLINKATFKQIINEIEINVDIISFRKKDASFVETTMSIYKSTSYKYLKEAIENRNYGLQAILRNLRTKYLYPINEEALFNVNTKADYNTAIDLLLNKNRNT